MGSPYPKRIIEWSWKSELAKLNASRNSFVTSASGEEMACRDSLVGGCDGGGDARGRFDFGLHDTTNIQFISISGMDSAFVCVVAITQVVFALIFQSMEFPIALSSANSHTNWYRLAVSWLWSLTTHSIAACSECARYFAVRLSLNFNVKSLALSDTWEISFSSDRPRGDLFFMNAVWFR